MNDVYLFYTGMITLHLLSGTTTIGVYPVIHKAEMLEYLSCNNLCYNMTSMCNIYFKSLLVDIPNINIQETSNGDLSIGL